MNKFEKVLEDIQKDSKMVFFHWKLICEALKQAASPVKVPRVKIGGVYQTNLEKCKVDLEDIIKEKGYSRNAILGRARNQFVCDERRFICAALYGKGYSLTVIGAALKRDRTTVSNYLVKKQQKSS